MQKCFLEIRPNSDFPISENLKMGASDTFQAQDSNVSLLAYLLWEFSTVNLEVVSAVSVCPSYNR